MRSFRRRARWSARAAALLAMLVLGGCSLTPVTFRNASPTAPRTLTAWRTHPTGSPPFPAVVLLHGCHGVSASTVAWANWLTARGYVALIVDSWTARGMREGCTPESIDVPASERFEDIVGALRFLHRQRDVDPARVGIIGWSNGGVLAMSAVNAPSLERQRRRGVPMPEPGFQAAVGVYPGGCWSLVNEQVVRPLLVLIGSSDDWTLAHICAEMVAAMRARGAPADIVVYPGAVHYFDVVGQRRTYLSDVVNRNLPHECCGATIGYDPNADIDAHRRIADFLERNVRDASPPR
jgi:dienelactone hydrolase